MKKVIGLVALIIFVTFTSLYSFSLNIENRNYSFNKSSYYNESLIIINSSVNFNGSSFYNCNITSVNSTLINFTFYNCNVTLINSSINGAITFTSSIAFNYSNNFTYNYSFYSNKENLIPSIALVKVINYSFDNFSVTFSSSYDGFFFAKFVKENITSFFNISTYNKFDEETIKEISNYVGKKYGTPYFYCNSSLYLIYEDKIIKSNESCESSKISPKSLTPKGESSYKGKLKCTCSLTSWEECSPYEHCGICIASTFTNNYGEEIYKCCNPFHESNLGGATYSWPGYETCYVAITKVDNGVFPLTSIDGKPVATAWSDKKDDGICKDKDGYWCDINPINGFGTSLSDEDVGVCDGSEGKCIKCDFEKGIEKAVYNGTGFGKKVNEVCTTQKVCVEKEYECVKYGNERCLSYKRVCDEWDDNNCIYRIGYGLDCCKRWHYECSEYGKECLQYEEKCKRWEYKQVCEEKEGSANEKCEKACGASNECDEKVPGSFETFLVNITTFLQQNGINEDPSLFYPNLTLFKGCTLSNCKYEECNLYKWKDGSCLTSCSSDDDCINEAYCDNGQCKLKSNKIEVIPLITDNKPYIYFKTDSYPTPNCAACGSNNDKPKNTKQDENTPSLMIKHVGGGAKIKVKVKLNESFPPELEGVTLKLSTTPDPSNAIILTTTPQTICVLEPNQTCNIWLFIDSDGRALGGFIYDGYFNFISEFDEG